MIITLHLHEGGNDYFRRTLFIARGKVIVNLLTKKLEGPNISASYAHDISTGTITLDEPLEDHERVHIELNRDNSWHWFICKKGSIVHFTTFENPGAL